VPRAAYSVTAPGASPAGTLRARSPRAVRRAPARAPRLSKFGWMVDAGLPDGAIASLVLRPASWLRFAGGAGTNSASAGVRGGFSITPFPIGPSLTLEVGHYLDGPVNSMVQAFVGGVGRISDYVRRMNYTYANAHVGVDIGNRTMTFFVHGGLSYVHAVLRELDTSDLQLNPGVRPVEGITTVRINTDPEIRLITPSVKIGLIVYLE